MNNNYRIIPETSDDQAITKHFADQDGIRTAVVRAIRYCQRLRQAQMKEERKRGYWT